MTKRLTLALLLATSLLALPAAAAPTVLSGQTAGGAWYRIVVPETWNGDLVVWNHGLSLAPVGPVSDIGPLASLQLSEGYAVAASSYQQIGWAVFKSKNDLQELLDAFKAEFGRPRGVWLTGASLGGGVTAAALEEANLGNVVAAYTICGAVAGSRNWDGAIDLRLIYDAVCGDVPGAAIPGGAEGLPVGYALDSTGLALRVNACTGILLPAAARSPEQAERLAKILEVSRAPEKLLLTDMGYVTFAMSDLVHDPGKLAGQIGLGNAGVTYGDAAIDADIARVSPNPGASNRLARHFTPTGNVGPAKIVSIHTDKDGLVVVENESAWASIVPADQLATGIVVEEAPTHCGFTPAETAAGWEALRAWVAGAPKPSAAVLQGTCQAIVAGGLAAGPCRIDPAFVIPPIDSRIRPR